MALPNGITNVRSFYVWVETKTGRIHAFKKVISEKSLQVNKSQKHLFQHAFFRKIFRSWPQILLDASLHKIELI